MLTKHWRDSHMSNSGLSAAFSQLWQHHWKAYKSLAPLVYEQQWSPSSVFADPACLQTYMPIYIAYINRYIFQPCSRRIPCIFHTLCRFPHTHSTYLCHDPIHIPYTDSMHIPCISHAYSMRIPKRRFLTQHLSVFDINDLFRCLTSNCNPSRL